MVFFFEKIEKFELSRIIGLNQFQDKNFLSGDFEKKKAIKTSEQIYYENDNDFFCFLRLSLFRFLYITMN